MPNLQPMERWRLADILADQQPLFNQAFGDEPSPLHFGFQAAEFAPLYVVSGCLCLHNKAA
ncbi:hypothetical protein [Kingella oralis]|uniref:hypothetical protein n=1 Tax=Kingella oralis TaxID=505 RepID=UPI002D8049C7|nr:hypothetical protein [Kingella oralis]